MSTGPHTLIATDLDPGCWLEEYGDALFRYALGRLHNSSHSVCNIQSTTRMSYCPGNRQAALLH